MNARIEKRVVRMVEVAGINFPAAFLRSHQFILTKTELSCVKDVMKQEQKKSVFKSKTVLVALVAALAALYEPAREWVAANPEIVLLGIAGIATLVQTLSKGKLRLFPEKKESEDKSDNEKGELEPIEPVPVSNSGIVSNSDIVADSHIAPINYGLPDSVATEEVNDKRAR